MNKINILLDKADKARMAVEVELMRMFPPGSRVEFYIMAGQVNPSTGTVIRPGLHSGYIRVEQHKATKYGRLIHRDVKYTDARLIP